MNITQQKHTNEMPRKQSAEADGIALQQIHRLPQLCAVTASGIALLALVGWLTNVRILAGQWNRYIPMSPSTALAFLLLGAALFCVARWHEQRLSRLFALAAASIVFLLGLLVLTQFISGVDLGVEQILSRTNEFLGSTPLGRTSPLTAISFLLESAALFILINTQRWHNASTVSALFAAGATGINAVILLGYAYGTPLLYGETIIPVAFPTAVAFVLIGIGQIKMTVGGVSALHTWSGATTRGLLLRAFLFPILLFILIESWLATLQPLLSLNPALWQAFIALAASVLIVAITARIAERTSKTIEQAEQALRTSEARHRAIVEDITELICRFLPDGTLTYVNDAFCIYHGKRRDELLGTNFVAGSVDDFPQKIKKYFLTLTPEQPFTTFEQYDVLPDGEKRWREWRDRAIYNDRRELIEIQSTGRDITERKRAEDSLSQRANEMNAIYQASRKLQQLYIPPTLAGEIIGVLENVLNYTYCAVLLIEETSGNLIPFALSTIKQEPDYYKADVAYILSRQPRVGKGIAGWVAQHGESVRSGDVQSDSRYYGIRQDILSELCVPLRAADQIIGVVNIESIQPNAYTEFDQRVLETVASQITVAIQNSRLYEQTQQELTERKRAEEAVQQSEARYRALVEQAADGIFITDAQGRYLDVNTNGCAMLGYTREEIIGKDYTLILLPEDAAQDPPKLEMLRDGATLLKERLYQRKDGTIFPIEISAKMLTDGRYQSIVRDTTERKRAEEELNRSRQQLRALTHHLQTAREEERTLIAREIHDELGQSLTALKMDLVWLTKRLPPEAHALHEKAQGMTTMITESLQLMRRIASDLRPGLLDDLGLIAAMEWQASEFTKRSEVVCQLNLPQELTLDRDRTTAIFRIFQETLTNITRHAQAKQIEVRLEADEAEIRLTVKDDGVGITADQINDPKSLGLIGVRERVVYFNGSVSIESHNGTIITVRIPK